ncbi:MAG: hypothetical protein H6993_10550 [Pseudomonadales bacterium]|nr:hypothetical protein [Pseudomonadales bacterium]MCP5184395.1 hypothetical protein [Pseudomonadales bacterium]
MLIISDGVAVYPQENEDAKILPPKVADVVVVDVPDGEMGEADSRLA